MSLQPFTRITGKAAPMLAANIDTDVIMPKQFLKGIDRNDLEQHDCLVLKERDNAFGIWHLERDGVQDSVRVRGPLSSNNGEIVLQWALDGRGVLLRSMWDVKPLLEQGKLVQVLHDYTQSANVWAVYPTRLAYSGKLRACVEFLQEHFKGLSI